MARLSVNTLPKQISYKHNAGQQSVYN